MGAEQKGMMISSAHLNAVNDASIGSSGALSGPGTLIDGQLGHFFDLTSAQALRRSLTSVGTLYGGRYQYVKFKAGTTLTAARGQVLYWDDLDNFVVTPDAPADARSIAGICLNVVTKGNYGFIQTMGVATCLCAAAVTSTTIGNLVVVVDDDIKVDGIAVGTAVTAGILIRAIGNAAEALANDGLKLVNLRYIMQNI